MMTNTITLGNEMIDIEEDHVQNEINNTANVHKVNAIRDNMISENENYSDGSDDKSNNTDDKSDDNNAQMYPSDCYSFLSLYGPIKTPGKLYILFHSRSTERFLHTMRYWFTHILFFCILIVTFFPFLSLRIQLQCIFSSD